MYGVRFGIARTALKICKVPKLTMFDGLYCVQDARWRRGETVSQKTARDQMISLEAVASSQLAFQPRGP